VNYESLIKDVAVCQSSPANLASTYRIVNAGLGIYMDDTGADIINPKNGDVVYRFEMENGLYTSRIKSGYKENKQDGFIVGKKTTDKSDAPSSTSKKIPRKSITNSALPAKNTTMTDKRTEPGKGKNAEPNTKSTGQSSNVLMECQEIDVSSAPSGDELDTLTGNDDSCYLVMATRRHH